MNDIQSSPSQHETHANNMVGIPRIVLKIHENGHGPRIVKLHHLPVTIGRSVHCDVVIQHPGISSIHARLERDAIGLIVLSDAGSKNGIWHDGRRVDQVHASRNVSVQFSEVHIDIVVAEILENTRIDQRPPEPSRVSASRVLTIIGKLLICYAIVLGVQAFRKFSEEWPPERPTELFGDAFVAWTVILCVTGGLALFNKLHAKRYQATRIHITLTLLFAFFGVALTVEPAVVYNLRLDWLRSTVPLTLGIAALLLALLQLIAILFANWPFRRQLLVSIAIIATGVFALQTYSAFEFAAGSRRIWDENLGLPVIDPKLGAHPTQDLLKNLRESIKTVDRYQQEDWDEVLAREREEHTAQD